ncbi:MAG: nucleotidyltransferase family protein [Eubacteriales bacterium]|nr:nucleotidyltransferase family protein [Eubacteriales bacterium]
MTVVGIIAEYNPFHQGHAYQLAMARELTGADYVLVVMSGNYVQRGAPAMFDKHVRAEAALRAGADLVAELPLCAATGSAEYFASGAVSLLARTGVVTDLCFGSECGDLRGLSRLADVLAQEPEGYRERLRALLREGRSFPAAREEALARFDSSLPSGLLRSPNNLLGLEYLKALARLQSPIRPHTLLRKGASYHENTVSRCENASASGIRAALLKQDGRFTEELLCQLPFPELYRDYMDRPPITEDAFSLLLLEKLWRISCEEASFSPFLGVTGELSNRIAGLLDDFRSFSQFTDLVKTRNLTRTAVSRALLHILLNVREYREPSVLRVLGFRRAAEPLMSALTERSRIAVSASPCESLSPSGLYPDHLYESVRSLLHGAPFSNETRRKLLVV